MSAHDTPEVGSGEMMGERCVHCGESRSLHGLSSRLCLRPAGAGTYFTPASPVPVQPADAGERLSEGERVDLSMAIIRAVYNGDGQVFYSVERILAAREAAWAEKYGAVVGERHKYRTAWKSAATRAGVAADMTESAEAELDEVSGRLSDLLCELTDGLMSKTNYSVRAMVQAVEAVFEKHAITEMGELIDRAESAEAALATALREKAEDRARVLQEVADEADSIGHHWSGAPALAFFALAGDLRDRAAALAIPTATGDE